MAVYQTDLSRSFGKVVGPGIARAKHSLVAIVAMTTAMIDNANDEVGLFTAPKGFVVTGATVSATDMDSSTGLAIDIGIVGTEALFVAAATVGQAGTLSAALAPAGHLYKFAADTQVRAFIQTAASGTPAAGTLKVELEGFFDTGFDTTALVAS
ncbi:conserved protein of unknown function [Hyphomicrobium sp. 1Nfss2.1]|uniref:hypothetical protein n=1 Tax=Hyphomicrobium sp. 1Nfss2.1 TaxID=3413936 RepID=UPI003C7B7E4C